METVLSIENLWKNYGNFRALKGLNLNIKRGVCVGLLGSNGAGKSTTIRMITGQLRPSSGQVKVMGIDPSKYPKKIHPYIGYIPDSQTLYDELSVQVNIEIFAQLFGMGKEPVAKIIERVQLQDKRDEKVKNLSRGLKQRVLIARALVHSPSFIILDEPTTGLDPRSAETIYEILEFLKKQGATILITTHLMNDVERLCDHIVFIDKGVKVEEGSPLELKRQYSLPLIEFDVMFEGNVKTHSLPKEKDWLAQVDKLRGQGEVLRIKTHEPKLEDIFISLVGKSQ